MFHDTAQIVEQLPGWIGFHPFHFEEELQMLPLMEQKSYNPQIWTVTLQSLRSLLALGRCLIPRLALVQAGF